MEALIFIVVIVALIVVHELGHFFAAKISGMRVDEFGLGYPPRIWSFKKGETEYSLNALPFGGFVRIYGEDTHASHGNRAFSHRPRILQAFVLVSGIAMNLLFAYVLITGALIAGTPRVLTAEELPYAKDAILAVTTVVPGSPAASAGITQGDEIVEAKEAGVVWQNSDPGSFTSFINTAKAQPVTLTIKRNGTESTEMLTPVQGLIQNDASRYALGIEIVTVGTVPVSFIAAFSQGFSFTWNIVYATAVGLIHFFASLLSFSANLSQVSGPIGIAQAVGSASAQGLGDLLSLMAVISINLALINLIPVPALDGGRLLFVIIESIINRPIRPSVAEAMNRIGFALLVLLMVVVTAHDIFRLAS